MRPTTAVVAALTAVLAAFAVAAPRAFAHSMPTYIWNGHGYTRHPGSSLRLRRGVLLTNIEWGAGGPDASQWTALYPALVSPSHWYRTDLEVERFDVCSDDSRQYVLTVSVYLPRRIPTSPLAPVGRAHKREFALPVPKC
jgi:hypothetical protein